MECEPMTQTPGNSTAALPLLSPAALALSADLSYPTPYSMFGLASNREYFISLSCVPLSMEAEVRLVLTCNPILSRL